VRPFHSEKTRGLLTLNTDVNDTQPSDPCPQSPAPPDACPEDLVSAPTPDDASDFLRACGPAQRAESISFAPFAAHHGQSSTTPNAPPSLNLRPNVKNPDKEQNPPRSASRRAKLQNGSTSMVRGSPDRGLCLENWLWEASPTPIVARITTSCGFASLPSRSVTAPTRPFGKTSYF
jgi:hypothetical protein